MISFVEIARTFRRVPQAAAIAVARPSGLERRVSEILDGRRRRGRLAKWAAALTMLGGFGGAAFIGCCATTGQGAQRRAWTIERSEVGAQLKKFVAEKRDQAYAAVKVEGREVLPEYEAMYAAAAKGDWPAISNVWEKLSARAPEYDESGAKDNHLHGTGWQTMIEISSGFAHLALGEEKYFVQIARDVFAVIPAGSIYFGGTDRGRCVITALQKSHVRGEPFFTLSQNGFADRTYLAYVRQMYGGKIHAATAEDSRKCFQAYTEDARQRLADGKLKPGEDVRMVDGKVQVSGQVAVMAINTLLCKVIFDKNPERECYVEESFPLEWMYPHLTPAGPILKLNREPVAELSETLLQRDREYWTRLVQPLIGDWLKPGTGVKEVAEFAKRANPPQPEPDRFPSRDGANRWVSKLRSSIAGVYQWRSKRANSAVEKARLVGEADFAFRQAFAVCPHSLETLFRYVSLLMDDGRIEEALLIAESAMKLQPTGQLPTLVSELKRIQASK